MLDLPLDQFAASLDDGTKDDEPPGGGRKKWAIPIGGPEQLARMWDEYQARREVEDG